MTDVQYPSMRLELIEHLKALSDIDYQKRVWVLGGVDGVVKHDEFDYAIHFLYDDTRLANDPGSMVGVILRNTDEVVVMSALIEVLEKIFQRYGTDLSDSEYIKLPEWVSVLSVADKAAKLICRSEV